MITYTVQVNDDGTKYWFLNGKRHREDGPAVEYANGDKQWFLNGKLHREDGPAIEYPDGDKFWYLNDGEDSGAQFKAKINPVTAPAQELTVAEISELLGYEVKVVK